MAFIGFCAICYGLLHLWAEHGRRKEAEKRKALRDAYALYVLSNYTVDDCEAVARGRAFMAKHNLGD